MYLVQERIFNRGSTKCGCVVGGVYVCVIQKLKIIKKKNETSTSSEFEQRHSKLVCTTAEPVEFAQLRTVGLGKCV